MAENRKLTPDTVKNTDLPIMVDANEPQSNSLVTNIKYKDFYQGATNSIDCQNDSPYVSLQTALMNTFTSDNYAFITLHRHFIALIKHTDNCIHLSDFAFLYFALAVSLQTLFKWTSMMMLVNQV